MPGGDRTGPEGRGPMTGRRLGYCAGNQIPGYESPRYGLDRGFGRRYWRRGRRIWHDNRYTDFYDNPNLYNQNISKVEEKKYLEDAIKNFEEEIKLIRKRLEEISKEKQI